MCVSPSQPWSADIELVRFGYSAMDLNNISPFGNAISCRKPKLFV